MLVSTRWATTPATVFNAHPVLVANHRSTSSTSPRGDKLNHPSTRHVSSHKRSNPCWPRFVPFDLLLVVTAFHLSFQLRSCNQIFRAWQYRCCCSPLKKISVR